MQLIEMNLSKESSHFLINLWSKKSMGKRIYLLCL